jgi:hypothetical protein
VTAQRDTSPLQALVVGQDRTSGFGPLIEQACIRSGVTPTFEGEADADLRPQLIIGALPNNRRLIPEEVVRLGDRYPSAVVVLLSSDPLVRATISLQRGRVILLSPPHDPSTVSRRLRQALWKVRQDGYLDTARGLNAEVEAIQAHVRVSNRFWAGMLSTHRSDSDIMRSTSRAETSEENVLMGVRERSGFVDPSGFLPQDTSLRTGADLAALGGSIPTGIAMVGLFAAQEWCVIHTGSSARIWLVSPLRFPTLYSISDRLNRYGEHTLVTPALTGDVLIVADGTQNAQFPDLSVALTAGGLGYHDQLRVVLQKEAKPFLGFAVEVI